MKAGGKKGAMRWCPPPISVTAVRRHGPVSDSSHLGVYATATIEEVPSRARRPTMPHRTFARRRRCRQSAR